MSRLSIGQRSKGRRLILPLLLLLFIQSLALAQPKPTSQPEDTLLFREGEILLSRGETEKALWRFKRLTTDYPNSPLYHEAKFRMGICYTHLKRPKDAIRILNELLPTFLSPSRMIQVFTLLGDNSLELKDALSALQWYGKGLLIPKQPQEELKGKVRSVIDTFDTEEALNQIESLYRGAYGGGYAKLKLAQMAKRRGDEVAARKIFIELEKEYRSMDYYSQAKDVLGPAPSSEKSKYTIGVILPLSGIHQPFGMRVLEAIQLAIKEKDAQGKPPLISLAIRDCKGNSKEAEKAVEELVVKERAIAIIGPLLSITVDQAARKAQQLKVPLLTLSQKEPAIGRSEFIFQNSLTPTAQVQTLVLFAIKTMELRTFAVFYPSSPYGLHFKGLFTQEVARMGGRMMGAVAYQEDQTDFSQEIKGFFRIKGIQDYDSRKKKIEEFKAGFSVDGIFIPDTHDRVGLILSQMAYYDITQPIFLGTNAWNSPDLIRIAGTSVEGALFVDTFLKGNASPPVSHFVEDFKKAYQREPETLEAISYDGAKLLGEVLRSKMPSSPLQVREEVLKTQNFGGVSGLMGFGEDGKAIRTLSVLRVKNGQIEQVYPQ